MLINFKNKRNKDSKYVWNQSVYWFFFSNSISRLSLCVSNTNLYTSCPNGTVVINVPRNQQKCTTKTVKLLKLYNHQFQINKKKDSQKRNEMFISRNLESEKVCVFDKNGWVRGNKERDRG